MEYRDPTIGTVLSPEYSLDMSGVSRSLLMRNSTVGHRTRVDAILGVATIGRGNEKHSTTFSDLGIKNFTDGQVGPSSANAVIMLLNSRKRETETTGQQFLSLIRHKDLLLCGVNSLAIYLHCRWEINGEAFPNLADGRDTWYDIQVFAHSGRGSDKKKQLSYSATYDQVQSVFKEQKHEANSANHFFRKLAIDQISINGQGHLDKGEERRLSGHNLDEHDGVYALNVPLSAVMVQAGFSATDWQSSYFLARAPDSREQIPQEFLNDIGFYSKANEWLKFVSENPAEVLADGLPICGASVQFASLSCELARVLLQDALELRKLAPDLDLFRFPPFNKEAFHRWSLERAGSSAPETNERLLAASASLSSPIKKSLLALSDRLDSKLDRLAELIEGSGDAPRRRLAASVTVPAGPIDGSLAGTPSTAH